MSHFPLRIKQTLSRQGQGRFALPVAAGRAAAPRAATWVAWVLVVGGPLQSLGRGSCWGSSGFPTRERSVLLALSRIFPKPNWNSIILSVNSVNLTFKLLINKRLSSKPCIGACVRERACPPCDQTTQVQILRTISSLFRRKSTSNHPRNEVSVSENMWMIFSICRSTVLKLMLTFLW